MVLLSPKFRVARFTLDERPGKKSLVTVMNGVVGSMCSCDEELGIDHALVALMYVVRRQRIHVMDVESIVNLVTFDTEVACQVSSDDMLTNVFPFLRHVKHLIHVTVETESLSTDFAMKR
jgi:hypothetical protein